MLASQSSGTHLLPELWQAQDRNTHAMAVRHARMPHDVQIWDHASGKLRKDLEYQAEERFMLHDGAILALNFSLSYGKLRMEAHTPCQAF